MSTAGPPLDSDRVFLELDSRFGSGDVAGAARIALSAIADGLRHPKLYYVIAQERFAEACWKEALAILDAGLAEAPNDVSLIIARATCLGSMGSNGLAAEAFELALELKPESYLAGIGLAQALYNLGKYARANAQYHSMSAAAPHAPDLPAGLAMVAVRMGRPDDAIELADRALAGKADHPLALEAKAEAAILNGDFAAAERLARSLVETASGREAPSTGLLRLGDALHGQGRFSEAFEAYAAGKSELARRHEWQFVAPAFERMDARVNRLAQEIEAIDPLSWSPSPRTARRLEGRPVRHGFILGFPRSGTTLLEEILAAHPDVVSLDERPTMEESEADFLAEPGGLERLAKIDGASTGLYHDSYWSAVDRFVPDRGQEWVIDKQPTRSVSLPIICKLFPEARILLAVRDPRDVVLSCFRRGFAMNASTYEFTSLDGTARFYDAVMRFIALCSERMDLNVQVVRLEQLVAGFETEISKILDFLGLDWADDVLAFADSARTRAIRTPSANQIRGGLTAEGFGVWRSYKDQLAPVMPTLEPWVLHWGYEA